ncbi:hypothetical protein EDB85DRAFT_526171 [Lactarius pseudohatsudake]|nr:hypothetical protein EDB85DRAFT_526171 [Lactarius pseudohatsudake]
MFEMFKKVNARERMIGWYHTGPKLRSADLEINELFKRFIARPVMVIVDVRPHTVGIPTDAYFAVEEIKDVRVYLLLLIPSTYSTRRTGRKRARRSCMRRQRSRRRRRRRSGSSICCATSKARRRRRSRRASRSSSRRCARLGRAALPRRRRARFDAREPPGRLSPPGRVQPPP